MSRAALLLMAACTPTQVQVATDLLTPVEARCAEARAIYREIAAEPRPADEMARLRLYVAMACAG